MLNYIVELMKLTEISKTYSLDVSETIKLLPNNKGDYESVVLFTID